MIKQANNYHRALSVVQMTDSCIAAPCPIRMGEFIATIQNSRLLDVDARVAQSLEQLFNPDLYPDTARTLAISQEEVGLLAGVSRQRINQALQSLEKQGILRLAYNQNQVIDLERLCAFGQEQI